MFDIEKGFSMAVNWWADPMILGKAPQYLEKVLTQEDLKVICQPFELFGIIFILLTIIMQMQNLPISAGPECHVHS